MNSLVDKIKRFNGDKLGNQMLQLFIANNTHQATSEAEVSGFYKDVMLNREYREGFQ